MAAQAVRSHEQEHVSHNAEKAQEQGKTAHSTVIIHTAICPECGRAYVSGGTTKTTYTDNSSSIDTAEANKGNFIDITL